SEREFDLAHHLGGVEVDPVPERGNDSAHRDGEVVVEVLVAVEGVAALDAEADVVPDRVLEAGTNRAADDRRVVGDDTEADEGYAGLGLREGDAAGHVQQGAVPRRIADAATDRRLPLALEREGVARDERPDRGAEHEIPLEVLRVDVAFDAEHPVAAWRLPIVADLAAGDPGTLVVVAETGEVGPADEHVLVRVRDPFAACVETDVEAGPVER